MTRPQEQRSRAHRLSTVETAQRQHMEVAPGGTSECPGILNFFEWTLLAFSNGIQQIKGAGFVLALWRIYRSCKGLSDHFCRQIVRAMEKQMITENSPVNRLISFASLKPRAIQINTASLNYQSGFVKREGAGCTFPA